MSTAKQLLFGTLLWTSIIIVTHIVAIMLLISFGFPVVAYLSAAYIIMGVWVCNS